MKMIDKAAVVAEIERKKEEEVNYDDDSKSFASYADHIYYLALDSMQDFINSAKVKEVDLEKELDSMITPELKFHKALPSLFDVAKHFFELGLRAQKGEV